MPETTMVKAIHSWKPISNRPTERPKTRSEDDVKKIYRSYKCQIGEPLCRIEEDGKNWLRRPKLCTKSCRAVIRRSETITLVNKKLKRIWELGISLAVTCKN
jgi:hypothetical protein